MSFQIKRVSAVTNCLRDAVYRLVLEVIDSFLKLRRVKLSVK